MRNHKSPTLLLCALILLSSTAIYNSQVQASISDLQIQSVPSFNGQMCGSAFTSNGTLFAGDKDYTLYRNDDNGATFSVVYKFPVQSIPESDVAGYVWTIFIDSKNTLFVSIPGTNRMYRSTDWGFSFEEVLNSEGAKNDGFYIAMTEDYSGHLYAATYCSSIYPNQPSLLKSIDGGQSWTTIRTFATVHLHNVKFNPTNGYLYVVTGEWTYGYDNGECERVFRSKDYGQTWSMAVNRSVEMDAIGNTVYLPMLFGGNWVYLGADQAFQPNWIDRFYDDGADTAFVTERVYDFPSDSNCPVLSGVWLNHIMLFSSTPEFYDGTTRVIASINGLNWQIIKEATIPQSLHHTNFLTINPRGIAFGSDGPEANFAISEVGIEPSPTPTPTATPTPTPTPSFVFQDGFESGDFNSWITTSGYGTYTQTIDTSNPHHGNYSTKVTVGADSEGWALKNIPPLPIVYLQQYIKLANLPTQGTRLYLGTIQNTNANNNVDVYVENSNGQYYWGVYSSIGGIVYHDREFLPSNLKTSVYYCVETCRDATNGRSKLWVDGNLKVDVTKPHVGYSNKIYSGISYSFNGATVYVDCVKVSTVYIEPESVNPTPTPTPPPTDTPTPTPSVTPSPSPTITTTPSPTITPTPTPTITPTPSPTTTATPSSTPTPTPTPNTYLFKADFETNSFSEYTTLNGAGTYTATIETANPYRGSYNAKFTTGTNSECWAVHTINSSSKTYSRQLIKLGSLPATGSLTCLGSIQNTNSQNTVDPFIYNNNGKYYWGIVSVVNGVFYWNIEQTASNPTAGTYYTVEFLRDVTNHKTTLWVDGIQKVDVTRNHVGNSNRICTGISWSDSAVTAYIDCVKVNSTYIGFEP